MDAISIYERLQNLIEFLHKFPTREQLIVYLSENICPSGEIAGVTTCYLDDESEIHIQFSIGFNLKAPLEHALSITDDNPGSEALRTMKTIFVDLKHMHKKYTQNLNYQTEIDYKSGVAIPVTSRRVYGFTFIGDVFEFVEYRGFFECLRSILHFYETIYESRSIRKIPRDNLENHELTSRQLRILDMVKENRTNSSIAAALGYSESLIRQETIIIYRKLGIDGRRELRKSVAS